ncbi:MAG TPA: VIT1/CCC1 transporter family protein [Candidatus Binataceae bacterium]|jgi:VIT1/CCC1 family predicted Fe2+/Mn2+ transporter|nr:VIT1/CCC1 transporter family protein [Candidatus Binataceae bacterium]
MKLSPLLRKYDQHTEKVHAPGGAMLGDMMFGLNDGLVATFAVTSGVAGAFASPKIVLMAGLAEMLGGAVSMGLAGYASARAHYEFYQSESQRERDEIKRWPERERDEVRAIYRNKGFGGPLLDQIVSHLTADPSRWRNVMMREELGFSADAGKPPSRSALTVGAAYLIGAAVPLAPYLFVAPPWSVLASAIATVSALFGVGAAKTLVTSRPWWRSGLESMGIGIAAAIVTYGAGRLFAAR